MSSIEFMKHFTMTLWFSGSKILGKRNLNSLSNSNILGTLIGELNTGGLFLNGIYISFMLKQSYRLTDSWLSTVKPSAFVAIALVSRMWHLKISLEFYESFDYSIKYCSSTSKSCSVWSTFNHPSSGNSAASNETI